MLSREDRGRIRAEERYRARIRRGNAALGTLARGGCGCLLFLVLAGWGFKACVESLPTPEEAAAREAERVESEREAGKPSRVTASVAAKQAIRARLKAPSTADFQWGSGDVADLGSGWFRVTSYVDSQNVFGAIVRTHYTVMLRHRAGDARAPGNWTIENVKTTP